ncbi:MAG TPA: aminotransferase class I/II-fold pyridoxal phosphate-dependent enzyme [Caldithrix abyssi]|uniref:Aminotransferase class I/II-fold pyridoxal phosphate-dependent enzyme n=1 Tax=Caldithrix abyssi TaxID=187145 RepID=A0A7V5H2W5_CALAY|nr:aminotransferase class I/II-fold pyridoxal phosphate-dependent enzyme [Caldithrix abyssi]
MKSIPIQSKLPDLEVSIFAVMTKLAEEHGAINLSQGFPDFNCNPRLIDLVYHYIKQGKNQYAPMPGLLSLRQALSIKIKQLYGVLYNPESEITITAGATEALYAVITAVVRPGDEVIIFEPFYDAYPPVVKYSGGIPRFIRLQPPDFKIPWEEVKKAINKKTRLIIINSPHNPTGAILEREDVLQLAEIVDGTSIFIVSDEVYEHIVFDYKKHLSLASHPALQKRTFVISSFGKTYHTTGWKVGYCAAPHLLSYEFRKIHQFITFAVNTPVQWAYADILSKRELYLELPSFYQAKRDLFRKSVLASKFELLPCQGTYFQLADYSRISHERDVEFVKKMTQKYKVAAIPLSPFYHEAPEQHIIRFCFAKQDKTLIEAGERLCQI